MIVLYVLNISVIQCVHFKRQLNIWQLMRQGSFYEELSFQHYLQNITQEPQELQRYNRACRFIGKSAVIKCHQLLSKITSITRRLLFRPLGNRYLLSLSLKSVEFYTQHSKLLTITHMVTPCNVNLRTCSSDISSNCTKLGSCCSCWYQDFKHSCQARIWKLNKKKNTIICCQLQWSCKINVA